MTRISYSPILSAGDNPARSPENRPFVPSSGGGSVFDIDSQFTASRKGDFFKVGSTGFYEDNLQADPADTAGDLIQQMVGGRSAGTALVMNQSTASSRPELAADATYGQAVYYLASSNKNNIASWGIVNSSPNGLTFGMRIRRPTFTLGGASDGFALGQDFNSFDGGLGSARVSTSVPWVFGDTAGGSLQYVNNTTDWVTVLGRINTSGDAEIYFNDSDTPVASGNIAEITTTRLLMGHTTSDPNDAYVYSWLAIDEYVSDVAGYMAWLEA